MENFVEFDISTLPITQYADYGFTKEPIYHANRTSNNEVLLFILSGCMPVVEGEKEYFLRAGDVFFLKQGIHHWGKTLFEPDTSWYYVHFTHERVGPDVQEISPEFFHQKYVNCSIETYKKKLTLPKHIHNMLNTDIQDKFAKLVELFNSSNPYLSAYVNTCLHQLLVDIYMHNNSERETSPDVIKVHQIMRYLGHHTREPFDSAKVEKEMGLNYRYMCELFKNRMGMTMHEFHTKTKMNLAVKLLCGTDKPINEISEHLGYNDPLYFSNVFKKNMGMSPRKYRDKYTGIL